MKRSKKSQAAVLEESASLREQPTEAGEARRAVQAGEAGGLDGPPGQQVAELADLLEVPALQRLMDDLYLLARIPMAILDVSGRVLVGVGWQEICTRFHRVHPDTARHCLESDTVLSSGLAPGECRLYRCRNNLWDMATPIVVGGRHLGNVFTGQFLFEDEVVDREAFREQGRRYGFDEAEYLAALDRVPRVDRDTVDRGMVFVRELAYMLSRLAYNNIQLNRLLGERARLTESLGASQERLKRTQQMARLGSWELDLDRNELTWSDEVYRIFGLEPQQFGATYEAFLERVHPDDRTAVDAAYSGSLREDRDGYEIEHRVVRADTGETRFVLEKCDHVRDAAGRIVGSIGMVHDITEHKGAEEALQWSVRRHEVLSQTARQLLMSADPRGLVEGLCRQVMDLLDSDVSFNFLVDERVGRLRLNACVGIPEEAARSIEWLDPGAAGCGRVARDGEPMPVEDILNGTDPGTELVRSFGIQAYCCHPLKIQDRVIGTLSFGTRSRPRFRPEEVEVMKAVADLLTSALHRMEIEGALRQSREDLDRSQEVGQIGWWRLDTQRNVLTWSTENYRIFGVPPGTPLTYETFLEIVHPADRAQVDRAWNAGLGGEPYDIEHRLMVGDQVKWVREKAYLEFDDSGQLLGGFGITQDITERKRSEEALAARTAELAASNKELEAFAYSVSHDLRAPLRAIDGFSRAVLEDHADKLDAEAKGYLRRARAASQQMAELIDGLLALSRTALTGMRRTTVDLSALARSVADEIRRSDPSRRVVFEIAPGLVVHADAALMRVLLQNLLGNAWKFTSKHPTARIEVGGCPDVPRTGTAAYFVRDDGAGFDMAYVDQLFGVFQRLHTAEEFEGTGIGLATVQRIVNRHGGEVWGEGRPEGGAAFYFTLGASKEP